MPDRQRPRHLVLCGLLALTLSALADGVAAQPIAINNPDLDGSPGDLPIGWATIRLGPQASDYQIEVSAERPHSGAGSARLASPGMAEGSAAALTQQIAATSLRGKRVRFRAAVRNAGGPAGDGGAGHVGLMMRVDRASGASGFFDNMSDRPIRNEDWTIHEITGDVARDATRVIVGFMVTGAGEAFFDSASLEIVGDAAPDPDAVPPTETDMVAAWLRENAEPLAATEIGAPRADLAAFSQMIGEARIVSLGEATHGSREHFQLKGRLVEHLVETHGFTAFGIEASYADTLAVNRFVLTGEGDLNTVVAGMGFWTWATEEVAELVQWIRDYNVRAPEGRQVRFYGFDAQALASPLREVATYLSQAGPPLTGEEAALADSVTEAAAQHPEQLRRLDALAANLAARLDRQGDDLIQITGPASYFTARQAAAVLRQAVEIAQQRGDPIQAGLVRDRFMADNVDWILDQEGPAGRVILWAHNGHVMHGETDGVRKMGGELEQRHGEAHVTVGFLFGAGGFQAIGPTERSPAPRLRSFVVGPEPDTLDGAFARTESPYFYVDLRPAEREAPAVWSWLVEEHPTRWIGSMFDPAWPVASRLRPVRIAREFDIVVMTLATTPARPLTSRSGH